MGLRHFGYFNSTAWSGRESIPYKVEIYDNSGTFTPLEIRFSTNPFSEKDITNDEQPYGIKGCRFSMDILGDNVSVNDFYTIEGMARLVKLFDITDANNPVLVRAGYLISEDIEEDYVDGVKVVSITATDGLELLKTIPFEFSEDKPYSGIMTGLEVIFQALRKIELNININTSFNYYQNNDPKIPLFDPLAFFNLYANLFEGKDSYEVLNMMAQSLRCSVFQEDGEWWFIHQIGPQGITQYYRKFGSNGLYISNGTIGIDVIEFQGELAPSGGQNKVLKKRSYKKVETTIELQKYANRVKNPNFQNGFNDWNQGYYPVDSYSFGGLGTNENPYYIQINGYTNPSTNFWGEYFFSNSDPSRSIYQKVTSIFNVNTSNSEKALLLERGITLSGKVKGNDVKEARVITEVRFNFNTNIYPAGSVSFYLTESGEWQPDFANRFEPVGSPSIFISLLYQSDKNKEEYTSFSISSPSLSKAVVQDTFYNKIFQRKLYKLDFLEAESCDVYVSLYEGYQRTDSPMGSSYNEYVRWTNLSLEIVDRTRAVGLKKNRYIDEQSLKAPNELSLTSYFGDYYDAEQFITILKSDSETPTSLWEDINGNNAGELMACLNREIMSLYYKPISLYEGDVLGRPKKYNRASLLNYNQDLINVNWNYDFGNGIANNTRYMMLFQNYGTFNSSKVGVYADDKEIPYDNEYPSGLYEYDEVPFANGDYFASVIKNITENTLFSDGKVSLLKGTSGAGINWYDSVTGDETDYFRTVDDGFAFKSESTDFELVFDFTQLTADTKLIIPPLSAEAYILTSENGWVLEGNNISVVKKLGSTTAQNWNIIHSDLIVATVKNNVLDLLDNRLDAGAVQFNVATAQTVGVGKTIWNDTFGTLEFGLKGGNVNYRLGQSSIVYVKNADNAGLTKGTVVYTAGSDGVNKTVRLAQANAESTSSKTFGIIAETVSGGSKAFCITFGNIEGINTSAFAEGATVYLSPTVAGGMTTTKPSAPNHMVVVGFCLRSHATLGVIFVKVQNGFELDEIHDVSINALANNNLLAYEAGTTLWKNKSFADLGLTTGTGTTNFVTKWSNATGGLTNSQIFDNGTNVGIGTTSPTARLDIVDSTGIILRHSATANTSGAFRLIGGSYTGNGMTGIVFGANLNANDIQYGGGTALAEPVSTHRFYVGTYGTKAVGTEVMRIDNNGNVGIGVTSVQAKLHVLSTTAFQIQVQRSGVASGLIGISALTANSTGDLLFDTTQASQGFTFRTRDSGNTIINALGIDRNGNVGINVLNPSTKLDVRGQVSADLGSLTNPAYSFVGDLNTGLYSPGSDTLALVTNGLNRVHVDSIGRVGIGVSSPVYNLDVVGSVHSTGNAIIDSNVGIGTISPASQLHIYGVAPIQTITATNGSSGLRLNVLGQATNTLLYRLQSDGVTINAISSDGNVGIGSSYAVNANLSVSRNIDGSVGPSAILVTGVVQAVATNSARIFQSSPNVVAGHTLPNLFHFAVLPVTTYTGNVTTQQGFYVPNNLTGATDNYGFRGSIPSGTGRWNLYMDGTATNYMAGSLGIGTTSITGYNLRVFKNFTGAVSTFGITAEGVVQNDVTTQANSFLSNISIAAAPSPQTLSFLVHNRALQGAIGANVTLTNQYGYWADATLIGATTNFGFRGAIPIGTGRWNLYMDGTAQNYIRGNVGIGSGKTVPTVELDVAGTIATTNFRMTSGAAVGRVLQSDASGNASWVTLNTSGYLGTWNANTNTPTIANGTGTAGQFYIVTTAGTWNGITFAVQDQVYYNGTIWQRIPSAFTLPVATSTVLGGVKISTGLTIDGTGNLSVSYGTTSTTAATGDHAHTFGGDVSGSGGTGTISMTLATVNSNVGQFTKVTVNEKGLVTAAENPTTVSGYGITDVYTKTESDARYVALSGSYSNPTWITALSYSKLTNVPSTFAPAAHTLDSHSNVTITSNLAGEVLKWNGTAWVNNTLAEAGIQATLGGTGLVLSTAGVITYIADNSTNWNTAFSDRNKWDGGATGLVAATGRTSLGLVIGTDVQAYDADLQAIASLSGASGILRKTGINLWSLDTASYLTSVNLTTNVIDVLPIANGGTGSSTRSFVMTTGDETIAGSKTFTSSMVGTSISLSSGISAATLGIKTFGYGLNIIPNVTYNLEANGSKIYSGNINFNDYQNLIITAKSFVFERGNVKFGGNNTGATGTVDFATERLDIDGNIRYSGTLKPSNVQGTSGQFLKTSGTQDSWSTITTTDISNLSSYVGFDSRYQLLDADLTAIAALTGTSGLLRKTTLNTWSLDTASYFVTPTGLTTNYVSKWNGTAFANSQIFDNGISVGIAIATPSATSKLHVNNAVGNSVRFQHTYFTNTLETNTSFARGGIFNNAEYIDEGGATKIWKIRNYGANDAAGILFANSGVLNFISVPSTGTIDKSLTHSEFLSNTRMTILPSGNVGINTTNPVYTLDVTGTIRTASILITSGATSGNFLKCNNVNGTSVWSLITTSDISNLSSWAGSTSITTLGTITSGTWNGTAIGTARGGTGLTALGTANQILRVNAGATALEYFTPTYINLSSLSSTATGLTYNNTTGVFSMTSGYTIPTTLSFNQIAYANSDGRLIGSSILTLGESRYINLNSGTGNAAFGVVGNNAFAQAPNGDLRLEAGITPSYSNTVISVSNHQFNKAIFAGGTTGTVGQVLSSTGTGVQWINASATLSNTFIGFGSGSNLLTGSSALTWDYNQIHITGGLGTFNIGKGGGANTDYWVDAASTILNLYGTTVVSKNNHNFEFKIALNGSYGTAGQVLTSQGPSANPTWTTVSGASVPLTSERIAFGSGSNVLSSSGSFRYIQDRVMQINRNTDNYFFAFGYNFGLTEAVITSENGLGGYGVPMAIYAPSLKVAQLGGAGLQMVTVDNNGILGKQAIPSGGGGGSLSLPSGEVAIGTGTGVTSSSNFKYDSGTLNLSDFSSSHRNVIQINGVDRWDRKIYFTEDSSNINYGGYFGYRGGRGTIASDPTMLIMAVVDSGNEKGGIAIHRQHGNVYIGSTPNNLNYDNSIISSNKLFVEGALRVETLRIGGRTVGTTIINGFEVLYLI